MTKYDYKNNKRDIWISVIGIVIMVAIIIGIAVFGYMKSSASHKGSYQLHHLEVANHITTINKAYGHKDGIKSIAFNAKKNHLIIYMDSQKHKPAHHYKDAILPITAQSEHALHVGHMIGNSYNDHHIKTYFKD